MADGICANTPEVRLTELAHHCESHVAHLRGLQPVMNVMVRDILDDIISELEAAIKQAHPLAKDEERHA